jgi:hypothetical protein
VVAPSSHMETVYSWSVERQKVAHVLTPSTVTTLRRTAGTGCANLTIKSYKFILKSLKKLTNITPAILLVCLQPYVW